MRRPKRTIVILVTMLILVGLWSTQALPGSIFYGYKTNINDPFVKLFNFTKERKARFEVNLLEKRLSEAVALIRKEQLTDKAYMAWLASFRSDWYAVQARISAVRDSQDPLLGHAIAVEENAVIQGFVTAMPFISGNYSAEVQKIVDEIAPLLKDSATDRDQFTQATNSQYSKYQYLGKVEDQVNVIDVYTSETRAMFQALESKVSKDMYLRLGHMQEEVDRAVADAKDSRARDLYPDAGLRANEAHALSRQLRVIVDVLADN